MAELHAPDRNASQAPDTSESDPMVRRNERIHRYVIEQLSAETGWRPDEIDALYKRVMQDMAAHAKVHDFLFVLAPKHVKRMVGTRGNRR